MPSTRSNNDIPTDPVEDPEGILRRENRVRRNNQRDMADPQENNVVPNEGEGDDNLWDREVYTGPIPNLYMPDLNNTRLQDAVTRGMVLNTNNTEYLILCPALKRYIGTDKLKVHIPTGRLEIVTDPPIRFVADCSSEAFSQNNLLIDAMNGLKKQYAKLTTLPGEDFRMYNDVLMQRSEVEERLGIYAELSIKYAQSCIKLEATQLITNERERGDEEYNLEVLMRRISGILDKIVNSFARDNTLRKRRKKITIPLPKLNVRVTTYTMIRQVKELAEALNDELENIMKLAFKPEELDPEVRANMIIGDDIPDENETRGRQTQRGGATTHASNNTRSTERLQVNFKERDEQRRNTLAEVRNTMLNITNSGNQANAANVCPDCQDGLQWPRNNDRGRDNMSSASSDAESVGHWDNNWTDQDCSAGGDRGHLARNCPKKQRGELYCSRCRKTTHCDATCSGFSQI